MRWSQRPAAPGRPRRSSDSSEGTCAAPSVAPATRTRLHTGATVVPVDLAAVLVDGRLHWFVAHLVARRGWWRGPIVAAMNAQHLGPWDVAPRGHPNDGRLDVFEGDLGLGDRWKARRRLATGTHVPHPGITERHVAAVQLELTAGTKVWLDGEPLGDGPKPVRPRRARRADLRRLIRRRRARCRRAS